MSAKRWCFTLNNYSTAEVEKICECLTGNLCVYAIVGKECGSKTGTRHLQGFVHFKARKYMKSLKKLLGDRAHLEIARGSDKQNKVYCEKEGDVLLECGVPAENPTTNKSFLIAKEIVEMVAGGGIALSTLLDMDEKYVQAYAKHTAFVDTCIVKKKDADGLFDFKEENLTDHLVMYRWQVELYDMLVNCEPHPRNILWYVDTVGGAGKSTFCNYFMCRHRAVCFSGGKLNDLAYVYDREPVVFFDLVRSGCNDYLYGFMEQIKNGRIFCSKYQSCFKFFSRPHVVVFANSYPAVGAFSADRLEVFRIVKNEIFKVCYGR